MQNSNEVTVIIPAFNEEKTIMKVIDKINTSAVKANIIVVNNASTDKTAELAKGKGVQVIECKEQGKGYAMETGIQYVNTKITLFIDGDLEIHDKDVIQDMIDPIIEEDVDFVKSAFTREGGRVTELVAKPLLELLFPHMFKFEQPLSGIIAGKTEFFKKITFEKDYGVDIGILLDMLALGARIEEKHIGKVDNNSKSWESLNDMSKQVMKAILKRKK
ncbi:MAG: glycosyltransferase [Clostridia bacterium]|nr:glycosyltransferase [Clostridia bacterium]